MKKEKTLFQKFMIGCGVLFVILVTASIIMQKVIDCNKEKIYESMKQELTEAFSDDPYFDSVYCGEYHSTIAVKTSFANLTHKEQLEKTEQYQIKCTAVREKYFNKNSYMNVTVMTRTGIELVTADDSGLIKIVDK